MKCEGHSSHRVIMIGYIERIGMSANLQAWQSHEPHPAGTRIESYAADPHQVLKLLYGSAGR